MTNCRDCKGAPNWRLTVHYPHSGPPRECMERRVSAWARQLGNPSRLTPLRDSRPWPIAVDVRDWLLAISAMGRGHTIHGTQRIDKGPGSHATG
jgi:hypothetical protein